jgi:hypothetical protein
MREGTKHIVHTWITFLKTCSTHARQSMFKSFCDTGHKYDLPNYSQILQQSTNGFH